MIAIDMARSSLADHVAQALSATITSGTLSPGDKLPTGQKLAEQYGVSLTVVREAISSLRAEGLIESRQGSGVFVAPASSRQPFRIPAGPHKKAEAAQRIFELRVGVEVTAAGLAAARRNKKQLRALENAHAAMVAAAARGEPAVDQDLAFHRALAEATGNELFTSFLGFLGYHIRDSILTSRGTSQDVEVKKVIAEHGAILEAVAAGSAERARAAMQRHMDNCFLRCDY
jgi:GntR family transcriptional regulator, transcriptional repressor for pyruvate dehydrogenase complex